MLSSKKEDDIKPFSIFLVSFIRLSSSPSISEFVESSLHLISSLHRSLFLQFNRKKGLKKVNRKVEEVVLESLKHLPKQCLDSFRRFQRSMEGKDVDSFVSNIILCPQPLISNSLSFLDSFLSSSDLEERGKKREREKKGDLLFARDEIRLRLKVSKTFRLSRWKRLLLSLPFSHLFVCW